MGDLLSYSFHLGRDKNKSKSAQEIAKTTPSGETSFADNAIHNLKDLSDVNNHNHRAYDNKVDDIEIIIGTNNVIEDVKILYLEEFEKARNEYNNKQTRNDRKIENYLQYVSDDKKKDIACEIIIELGDMEFWKPQELSSKKQMTEVFAGQVEKLKELLPDFKVANVVAHYDETSPHLHIVGVPVKEGFKTGLKKQVCKSKVFTKEVLTKLQDDMRNDCIERYNQVFKQDAKLKIKENGRNKDFNVKDMKYYGKFKNELANNKDEIDKANKESEIIDSNASDVEEVLEKLKPVPFNKNNKQISNDDIEKINQFAEDVKKSIKGFKTINNLKKTMEEFEETYQNLKMENRELHRTVKVQQEEIEKLKEEVSFKDGIIGELKQTISVIRNELDKFKGFWRKLLRRFQDKIFDERTTNISEDKKNFTIVAEDLEKNGIFDNNDSDIIHDISKKVLTVEEQEKIKSNKNKNRKKDLR